jgi:23S rRNA pseudouridine2605 synthase
MERARADRSVGVARMLSKLGYCSRTQAAELVRTGHVSLNGKICYDPEISTHMADRIAVSGIGVSQAKPIYLAMNKPRGVVTTASDEKGRKTVYELLDSSLPWVAPVGRLDKASEGLLLLTNDSEWSARITDPETHLEKAYHVQIGAITDDVLLGSMLIGVEDAGDILRVKSASRLRGGARNSWIEVVLEEGKNRHIRRMLDRLEVETLRLVRVAIGPLGLGEIAKGSYRALSSAERNRMEVAMRKT